MQLKLKLSFVFFVMIVASGCHDAYGQDQSVKPDSTDCRANYQSILTEYRARHFSVVDSLFKQFQASACFKFTKSNQKQLKELLRLMIEQKKLDNYRVQEADALQSALDSLKKKFPDRQDFSSYGFRFGPSVTINFSKVGRPGWSAGFILGFDLPNKNNDTTIWGADRAAAWGVDFGAFYQQMPFSFSVYRDKNPNGSYNPLGFILVSYGNNSLREFPLRFSYKVEESDYGMVGDRVVIGAELMQLQTTFVNSYHYEWNFGGQPIGPNRQKVTFNNKYIPKGGDRAFFGTHNYVDLIIGDDIYWRPSNNFAFIFSPEYHQNVFTDLQVANNYTPTEAWGLRPNNFTVRITCSYLFVLKKEKRIKNL